MKRQRGQSVVEFAFIAPLVFLMVFAAIYGGIMFMDFMNFSNDARRLARELAVITDSTQRDARIASYNKDANSKFASFYNVVRKVSYTYPTKTETVDGEEKVVEDTTQNPTDVVVTVTFNRDNKDLPFIVYLVNFPPQNFALRYQMKIEEVASSNAGS